MKNLITILVISLFTNLSFAQCEDFEVAVSLNNPMCYGFTDGSINLTISGESPYIIDIANSDGDLLNMGTGTANTLGQGWYFIDVVDAAGCTFSDSVFLEEPGQISVDFTITSPTEPGVCDGIITVDTVYNYQGDYEMIYYAWCDYDGGVGVNEITEACAGASCLMINDEVGCSVIIDFVIDEPSGILVNNLNKINVFINPETGTLNILNNEFQNAELTLFNLAGERVFSNLINEKSAVFMPALETGIYVYTIQNHGENIQTGKLKF